MKIRPGSYFVQSSMCYIPHLSKWLAQWNLVMHICVCGLDHQRFRLWLVPWLVPCHHQDQCWILVNRPISQIPECTCSISHNPHSEQKCVHFCSEWSIVGYGPGAFWDLRIRSTGPSGTNFRKTLFKIPKFMQTLVKMAKFKNVLGKISAI